jgi:hypothetical protein
VGSGGVGGGCAAQAVGLGESGLASGALDQIAGVGCGQLVAQRSDAVLLIDESLICS